MRLLSEVEVRVEKRKLFRISAKLDELVIELNVWVGIEERCSVGQVLAEFIV